MRILLIGGAPNTGKSNAVAMCANYLVDKGFNVVDCQDYNGEKIKLPKIAKGAKDSTEFLAILKGKDLNKKIISIVLNTASDTPILIDYNFDYLQKQNCDIYVSSIRDIGNERKYLMKKFNFTNETPNLLGFPLAKVSRRNSNKVTAKAWYDTKVQNMLSYILKSQPFEV